MTVLPGDVERVVTLYLTLADDAVPGLVEGLYLVGSVALDDFQPGVSDVDFIAVSSAPPDDKSAQALADVHARLAAQRGLPAFEGIYATFAELRRSPAESGGGLRIHDRKLSTGPQGRSPVEWASLARHGVTLRGPAAPDLEVHTSRGELTAWTLDNLDRYWSRWVAQGRKPASRTALASLTDWGVAWGVLGVSRLHYTVVTGQITSKTPWRSWTWSSRNAAGQHGRVLAAKGQEARRDRAQAPQATRPGAGGRTGESYTAALRHLRPAATAAGGRRQTGARLSAEGQPVLGLFQRMLHEFLPGRVEGGT